MAKNKVYAVLRGHQPGVYHSYDECKAQIDGFSNHCFKSFETEEEAYLWLEKGEEGINRISAKILRRLASEIETES